MIDYFITIITIAGVFYSIYISKNVEKEEK